jgi:tryptophan halogenase
MTRVVIVGCGIDAWMTAAALATAGKGVAEVAVAETAPSATGRIATLPSLRGLHARLGITEETLVRQAAATPRLGSRYGAAVEPFGETGATLDGLVFHHYWLAAGDGAPLADWSLAAQAAQRGRFAPASPDPRSPLSTLDHGWLLDATGYAELLKDVALKAGATLVDADHREADLLVDATGTEARLIGGEPWTDWSAWLPTGVAMTEAGLISTFETGAPLTAGRRDRAMAGDVVAVGTAHGAIGAADGGDLQLLQNDVSRLVALFPTGPAAIAEYNRLSEAALERARDMAILRWGVLDAPPEPLARKLTQFESRGRVVMYDEEAWPESAWVHAMLARGITPKRWDPLVERMPLERMREMLGRMKAVIEQTAEAMPRA